MCGRIDQCITGLHMHPNGLNNQSMSMAPMNTGMGNGTTRIQILILAFLQQTAFEETEFTEFNQESLDVEQDATPVFEVFEETGTIFWLTS